MGFSAAPLARFGSFYFVLFFASVFASLKSAASLPSGVVSFCLVSLVFFSSLFRFVAFLTTVCRMFVFLLVVTVMFMVESVCGQCGTATCCGNNLAGCSYSCVCPPGNACNIRTNTSFVDFTCSCNSTGLACVCSFTPNGCNNPSSAPCFHVDTVITYDGKDFTMKDIRAYEECSIPHVVRAYGVIVTAKCGIAVKTLKLTGGHLVYTQRGLQAAGDLKSGQDTLYADIAETTKCQVTSVVKESQPHEYFGLNCLNSQVLASGLKSSTFEKLHSIPAFWMKIMGNVLGVKRASQLGDYIGELVQKMNLV